MVISALERAVHLVPHENVRFKICWPPIPNPSVLGFKLFKLQDFAHVEPEALQLGVSQNERPLGSQGYAGIAKQHTGTSSDFQRNKCSYTPMSWVLAPLCNRRISIGLRF